jgi:hypothetical protein
MAVEEKACILKVHDWGQGARVEVLVGFWLDLSRKRCKACIKVLFKGLKGCRTDG